MTESKRKSTTVTADMQLLFSADIIWPLLCPVREYDWIEVWDCRMIQTLSGINELGCVFRTDFPADGETDTWVTSRFEPCERLEFVRTNSLRTIRYVITLLDDGASTRMTWTQHITPLSSEGEVILKNKTREFSKQMTMVEKMLNHYLSTGKMLKVA